MMSVLVISVVTYAVDLMQDVEFEYEGDVGLVEDIGELVAFTIPKLVGGKPVPTRDATDELEEEDEAVAPSKVAFEGYVGNGGKEVVTPVLRIDVVGKLLAVAPRLVMFV